MTTSTFDGNLVGVGSGVLHALRRSLSRDLGDKAAVCLQEAGYAAGPQIYERFCRWLPDYTGVDNPHDLDSAALGEVLSAFFESLGWGGLTIEQTGNAALIISSANWAEAEPGAGADLPSCYVASGLFADFMGRLAGTPVAVMEVECRTRGEGCCRFLVGAPATMESVYETLSSGGDYQAALAT